LERKWYFIAMEVDPKSDQPPEQPLYEWIFHPARVNWLVTTLVTVFLFLLLVIVYWLTESRLFTVIATIVLVGSMRAFYFATTYQLFEDRIKVIYTLSSISRPWGLYRSFYPERTGVFLSPFTRPSRLENFRGLFVRYGSADRQKILQIIGRKLKKEEDERTDVSPASPGGADSRQPDAGTG